jgi:hypothetical protein
VTEEEWLTLSDPLKLLAYLHGWRRQRRWRLFACACCRRIWSAVHDPRSRNAVEVAERYADGLASVDELATAREGAAVVAEELLTAREAATDAPGPYADAAAGCACLWAAEDDSSINSVASHCASEALEVTARIDPHSATTAREGLCDLIRDLFGNPFRLARADPSWLSWNNGTVARMAEAIYSSGTFEDLPVLADALEEAGCANADILAHCRGPGEHARGCWALDLLLGKFPSGMTSDETLEDKVVAFVWAFENVFDRDWGYTRLAMGLGSCDGEATFLNTGLTAEEESEDWGNRGALLQTYRELKRMLSAQGIRCVPGPRGDGE